MSLRKNQYYIGFNSPPHQSFIKLGKVYIMGEDSARELSNNSLVCSSIEDSNVCHIESKLLKKLVESYTIERTENLFEDISSFYNNRLQDYLKENCLGQLEYMSDWGNHCFINLENKYKDIKPKDFLKVIQTMAKSSFDYDNTIKLKENSQESSLSSLVQNYEDSKSNTNLEVEKLDEPESKSNVKRSR